VLLDARIVEQRTTSTCSKSQR